MAALAVGLVGFALALLPSGDALPLAAGGDGPQPSQAGTGLAHHAVLLGHRRTGLDAVVSGVEAALSKATSAAKLAWAMTDGIKKQSEESLKLAPLVEAEVATVERAATTAKEQDDLATQLLNQTRTAVEKAAYKAAEEYYMKVKRAGSQARDEATARALETRAVDAAAHAAKPYKESYFRAKKVMMEYLKHAKALALASHSLQAEGANESTAAIQYQTSGQVLQAEYFTKMAQALLGQADTMMKQAKEAHAQALRIEEGLPKYDHAGQAASDRAAAVVRATATAPPIY